MSASITCRVAERTMFCNTVSSKRGISRTESPQSQMAKAKGPKSEVGLCLARGAEAVKRGKWVRASARHPLIVCK
jgi:hypothetical protein